MTTLFTLFAISLFGLLFLLVYKWREEKIGGRSFLPDWLYEKDEDIKRQTMYIARRAVHWGKHKAHIATHAVILHAHRTVRRIGERSRLRPSVVLEKNGSGSVFLKQVNDHKQKVRRENGYHQE